MRRALRLIFAGAAVGLVPAVGLAAIDGSHHDMTTYRTGTNATTEKCAYCHAVVVAGTAAGIGQVGTFCAVVCHANANLSTAAIGGPGYFTRGAPLSPATFPTTAGGAGVTVLSASHGLDPMAATWPALDGADGQGVVEATRWPHTNATEGVMQCTSCHAVHDSANPPFLNAPLGTGANGTAFCQKCHNGAATATTSGRVGTIGTPGSHPTEFTVQDDGTAGLDGGNASALPRDLGFTAGLVKTVASAATRAAFDALNDTAAGNTWKMGGHFWSTANTMPTATTNGATMGCYSCHSAHQSQAGLANTLILADYNGDVDADSDGDSSTICLGCHGLAATINNPGDAATSAYFHPTNEAAALPYQHDHAVHGAETPTDNPNTPVSGTFPIPIRANVLSGTTPTAAGFVGTPVTTAGDGEILCVTCHDVHGGVLGLLAIRQLGGVSTTSSVCIACHEGNADQSGLASNWHHPSTSATTNHVSSQGYPATLGWRTGDGLGNLADGMSCPDCHVFQGTTTRRSTAHNW